MSVTRWNFGIPHVHILVTIIYSILDKKHQSSDAKEVPGHETWQKKVNSETVEQSGQAYAQMYTVRAYSTCVCMHI